MILSSRMNWRIRVERPVPDDSLDGAGSGSWALVCEVAAEVQDALPSRGERLADGINAAARPARVRIRFRRDVTASMRVLIGRTVRGGDGVARWHTDRTAEIVTVPAELGFHKGLEFMIEDCTSAGNAA